MNGRKREKPFIHAIHAIRAIHAKEEIEEIDALQALRAKHAIHAVTASGIGGKVAAMKSENMGTSPKAKVGDRGSPGAIVHSRGAMLGVTKKNQGKSNQIRAKFYFFENEVASTSDEMASGLRGMRRAAD